MKRYFILTCTLLTSVLLFSQRDFQIISSSVSIAGTSTLHDWTADVNTVSGSATITLLDNELKGIPSLKIKMDVSSIKSEKGNMMDKNIYKALNNKDYPYITFNLKKVNSLTMDGLVANLKVEGELTIAGTTRTVNLTATGSNSSSGYKFEGAKKIKMTDFNVEPPEFMLGAMKTGDEVTISYQVTVANNGLSHK